MELAHDRLGAGPPLVLIHGLGGTRGIWEPVISDLAAAHEVIALDMPGFGESDCLPNGDAATPQALGGAVAGFLRSLGIEQPSVAGNSLGGWVSLEMARAGHASSAIGLSPAGLWRRPLGPRGFDLRGLGKAAMPLLSGLMRSERARKRLLRSIAAHGDRIPADDATAMISGWIHSKGYDDANREMRRARFEDPAEIEVPVTIGWGVKDRLLRKPRADRMPPQTRFELIPDAGHTPTWDNPAIVTRLILEGAS